MEAAKKAELLNGVVRKMMTGGADIQTSEWLDFVQAQNDGARTGPAIGEKVPDIPGREIPFKGKKTEESLRCFSSLKMTRTISIKINSPLKEQEDSWGVSRLHFHSELDYFQTRRHESFD